MSLGPVMMDLVGTQVTAAEKELMLHPSVGGVILFTRNFESVEQIIALIAEIHSLRKPHLLIAIDHEGGRVQRFHEGFTRLPPAKVFGDIYKQDQKKAREYAELTGWLMAAELRAIDIDFSFAPVLDLAHGVSGVIGDRAFHSRPEVAATLAYAFMHGMSLAGMSAVGKHFPGHGGVVEDSHLALPVDHRDMASLMKQDIVPFEKMIQNHLPAIMPAHVIYDQVDDKPAGYSKIWLKKILRDRLKFQGVIFSDDLSMEAAGIGGSYGERAKLALAAGCDMVLVCNHPDGVVEVIEALGHYSNPVSELRLTRMHGKNPVNREELLKSKKWQQASATVQALDDSPWLELDV
ncbi:MAG: beta-N-acetylhexosaminidase [Gammaproteobacteria bacterium]|nr:beta-N-acetylhexosaminidase [Gammaproteobacteria bacterium]